MYYTRLSGNAGRKNNVTRMWANAQRDGRPAEYSWHPACVQRRKVCSNAAKMQNQLKFAGVPQNTGPISAVNGPKFTIHALVAKI